LADYDPSPETKTGGDGGDKGGFFGGFGGGGGGGGGFGSGTKSASVFQTKISTSIISILVEPNHNKLSPRCPSLLSPLPYLRCCNHLS
jgi:hypothetical protein